jgi:hypothetical protein
MSCILARKQGSHWVALPEVFALNTQVHSPFPQRHEPTLHVFPAAPTHVFLQGPTDLVEAYPQALETTLAAWADHFQTIPLPSDPRHSQDGFWPSFAPVPPLSPTKLEAARALCATLGTLALQSTGLTEGYLQVQGLSLDGAPRDRPSLLIYCTQGPQAFTRPTQTALLAWQTRLTTFLSHPSFPLQGRDWVMGAPLHPRHVKRADPMLRLFLTPTTHGRHGIMDSMATLARQAPALLDLL